MPRREITIVVNSLVQGGAQRAAISLSEGLANRGWTVQLVIFYPESTDFFIPPSNVKVVRLLHPFEARGVSHVRPSFSKIVRIKSRIQDLIELRRIIKQNSSQYVVAFEAYVGILVGLALYRSKIRLMISERVHPQFHKVQSLVSPFQNFVYRQPNVRILSQGEVISEYIRNKYGCEVVSIPNIVKAPKPYYVHIPKNIITMFARASHQKGIDILIRAWAQLNTAQRSDWNIDIYGQGDFTEYELLASKLCVSNSVRFHDATHDIDKVLSNSGIFVLPSRYEGFPNALAEAIAHGVPSIAADCPSAIRDLTSNGTLAVLFPSEDLDSLAFSIQNLIGNESLRNDLSLKSKVITKEFHPNRVLTDWEDAILGIFSEPKKLKCRICNTNIKKIRASVTRSQINQQYLQMVSEAIELTSLTSNLPPILRFLECSNCKHYSSTYDAEIGLFYEELRKVIVYERSSRWEYQLFEKQLFDNQFLSILDFGSSTSKWSSSFLDKHNVTLTDIDKDVTNMNNSKGLHSTDFSKLKNNSFSHICAFHVLEHLMDIDSTVKRFHALLISDGELRISVPNAFTSFQTISAFDWPPHHLSRFTEKSLLTLMQRNRFSLKETIQGETNEYGIFDFMMVFKKIS